MANERLIWIDLEMTGLNPDRGGILEIASLVTDGELHILEEGPNLAIRHPAPVLEAMEEWSATHHKASGLLDRVRASTHDTRGAEQATLAFLKTHCRPNTSPLCGNSVWQDRRFLIRHMPELESFLHYRNIDVSTIKELVRLWYPALPAFQKENNHLALKDIRESVRELAHYREHVFVPAV
jgi:oligoribonuclease